MNGIIRNIAVVLIGALASILTAAFLLFLEARSGQTLISYAIWTYIPLGAIGAGFVAAVGYMAGSLVLRVRPAQVVAFAIVAISASIVFLSQGAELGLMMAGKNRPTNVAAFSQFLGSSVTHTQLHLPSMGDSSDSGSSSSSSSSSFGAPPSLPGSSGGSDSRTDGISSGVSNMMATQDVSNVGPMKQIGNLGSSVDSIGTGVKSHSTEWIITGLQ